MFCVCSGKNSEQIRALSAVYSITAPNELYMEVDTQQQQPRSPLLAVVQLMLVDELGIFRHLYSNLDEDKVSFVSKSLIPGGLGSRRCAFLVATRWIVSPFDSSTCSSSASNVVVSGSQCQSRVMHSFSVNVSRIWSLLFRSPLSLR